MLTTYAPSMYTEKQSFKQSISYSFTFLNYAISYIYLLYSIFVRMLSSVLQTVCQSLSDSHQVVRSAGLFALGQFSEHLQVSHHKKEQNHTIIDEIPAHRHTHFYMECVKRCESTVPLKMCCLLVLRTPVVLVFCKIVSFQSSQFLHIPFCMRKHIIANVQSNSLLQMG